MGKYIMKVNTIFMNKQIARIGLCWFILIIFQWPQVGFSMPGDQGIIKLEEAFHQIAQKYEVFFNYDRSIATDIKVEYDSDKHQSLEEVLDFVLRNTNLGYRIFDHRFVVVFQNSDQGIETLKEMIGHVQGFVDEQQHIRKETLHPTSLLKTKTPLDLYSRRIVFGVSGTVTDESGEPLIGVNIQVKGTNKGTSTDFDGKFALEDIAENAVLVLTYVGYQSQEVQVAGKSSINITMKSDSQLLQEVVVTALGISREKKALGFSVGQIKGEDLDNVPQDNAVNSLIGKVPGLSINNTSNSISTAPQIIIRGAKSLTGNDAPLIVVDGLPTGNDARVLSDMNAGNIESISVLKGPSAAALYGSRAGNGVLLITTKSGKKGQGIGVAFNTSYAASVPYNFIPLQQRFSPGINGSFNPSSKQAWYGAETGTSHVQWNSNGEAVPLVSHPNNSKNFFNTGNNFINDVRIFGSTDNTSFNLSMSDTRATDIFPGSNVNKDIISFSGSHNLTSKVKVGANINVLTSGSDNFRPQTGSNYPAEDITFVPSYIDINDFRDYWEEKGILQKTWNSNFNNPWFSTFETLNKFKQFRAYGNIQLDWNFTENLSFLARVGSFNDNYISQSQHGKSEQRYPRGQYGYNTFNTEEINTDFLLNYNRKFGNVSVIASGGGNLMFHNTSSSVLDGSDIVLPSLFTASNINRSALLYQSYLSNKRVNSLYGTISADYNRTIYLELTGRNDWSSTLPIDNRSYFYPSISMSLLLNELFELPDFMDLVKLRGGWANVGKDTNPYELTQSLDRGNWGSLTTYSIPFTKANNNLRPESITSLEFGLDLNFLKNRLGMEVTYYTIEDKDQIMEVPTGVMTGFLRSNINAGVVEFKGIEVGLNLIPVQTTNFSWDLGFSFTKEKGKLIELPEGISTFEFWHRFGAYNQVKPGDVIGGIWGTDVMRVEGGKYDGWPLLNANGHVQSDPELSYMGSVYNDFSLGIQTSFSYKRVSLTANIDWRQGGKYYSESMLRLVRDGRTDSWYKGPGSSTFTGILSNHSFNGDQNKLADEISNNPDLYNGKNGLVYVGGRNAELGGFEYGSEIQDGAFYPGVRMDGDGNYIENFGGAETKYISSRLTGDDWFSRGVQTWLYDGSFVKLRELSINYSLPQTIAGKLKAKELKISLFARNLTLWTKAQNYIDPEVYYVLSQDGRSTTGSSVRRGQDRANMIPWTGIGGIKLGFQF